MAAVNQFMRSVFSPLWAPFQGLNPWVGILAFSFVVGLLALFAVKWFSNQDAIKAVKDRYKAHVLAIKLFQDNLRVVLQSLGRTLWHVSFYLGHNLRPMIVLIVPFVLIFAQMQMRLAYEPFDVGDREHVFVEVSDDVDLTDTRVTLDRVVRHGTDEAVDGVVETFAPVVQAAGKGMVPFPLEMKKEGAWDLVFKRGDEEVRKSLHVGPTDGLVMLAQVRSNSFMDLLLYPTEDAFPDGSGFEKIGMVYPTKPLMLFGFDFSLGFELGMSLSFLALTIVVALLFKGMVGVEF